MNVEVLPRRDSGPEPGEPDLRPVVRPPNAGLPGIAIAAIAALLAILLFFILDGRRTRPSSEFAQAEHPQAGVFAVPPPLVVPPEAQPMPAPVIRIPIQTRAMPAPVRPSTRRMPTPSPIIVPMMPTIAPPLPTDQTEAVAKAPKLAESALVYDSGAPWAEAATPATPPAAPTPSTGTASVAASVAHSPTRPTRIANLTTVIPTGTLIRAVLETPIDTSRTGMARAIVSKDARGFDGRHVLVPRGSRLIGEYEADVRTGQRKVLVNWTQLIRPDGFVIRLNSPAADSMGGAGIPGKVNSFFFERFFNAMLQSALTIGGSLATWSSDAPIIVGLPNSAVTNVVGQGGLMGQAPQPKITVKQGIAFNVFVARDLDFSGVPLRR